MHPPRLQLVELEDLPWWPLWLRNYQTDLLERINRYMRFYDGCLPRLRGLLEASGESQILDLCSGGGGPWPDWLERGCFSLPVQLSDLYPNERAFARLERRHTGLRGISHSLDMLRLGSEPPGLRTLFTALHHLPPDGVRQLLLQVSRSGRPLAAFDFNHRSWLNLLIVVPLAWLMSWLLTPLLRPSLTRLLYTYVVPLVPLALAWDGLVSQLRAYRCEELVEFLPPDSAYQWEVGSYRWHGLLTITYLLGRPQRQSPSSENDAQK